MLKTILFSILYLSSFNSLGAILTCRGNYYDPGNYVSTNLYDRASTQLLRKSWILLPQGMGAVSSSFELRKGPCVLIGQDKLECTQSEDAYDIQLWYTLDQPYPLKDALITLYSDSLFTRRVNTTNVTAGGTPSAIWTLNLPDRISFGDMRLGESKEITISTSTTGQSNNPAYMIPQWTEKDGVRFEPSGDLTSTSDGSQWILKDNGENKLKIIIGGDASPGAINVPVNVVRTCN